MQLSLVVPTYNERENVTVLCSDVLSLFDREKLDGEIIIVDDGSPDGTGAIADGLAQRDARVRVIHRSCKLGLSSAVAAGFGVARGDVVAVMDADLSHPRSALPPMLAEMTGEVDFVIGSRYAAGGSVAGWPLARRVTSRAACLLARLVTRIRDPMSGYFLIRRSCIEGVDITAQGFKICLELLMKARYRAVAEHPITFTDRQHGRSKMGSGEIFAYLRNLFAYTRLRWLGQLSHR